MIGARIEIRAVLRTLTPLHIGSGVHAGDNARETEATVAMVQTDASGLPCIPGSSLKGVARRMGVKSAALFGPDRKEAVQRARLGDAEPRSGRVIFRTALFREAGPAPLDDIYDNKCKVSSGETGESDLTYRNAGLFTEARTAIDDETGVAEGGRLFKSEIVRPDTTFDFCLIADAALAGDERTNLRSLLSEMADATGFGLGKGTRQSKGRVRLCPETLVVTEITPGAPTRVVTQDWTVSTERSNAPQIDAKTYVLGFMTLSPFLIADPGRSPDDSQTAPQISGLRDLKTGGPTLTGSTLLGALRAQSAYMEALSPFHRSDDKDAVHDKGPDASNLTITQRLFGITGWRGRVGLRAIRLKNDPQKQTIMSVRLDRFSVSPVDNALFGTEAWVAPEFEVELELDQRGLLPDDTAFFEAVLKQIADDVWGGLRLGLGKNKGFGAFTVQEIAHE